MKKFSICMKYHFYHLVTPENRTLRKVFYIIFLVFTLILVIVEAFVNDFRGFPSALLPSLYGFTIVGSSEYMPYIRESGLRKYYYTIFLPLIRIAVTLIVWILFAAPYVLMRTVRGYDSMTTASVILGVSLITVLYNTGSSINEKRKINQVFSSLLIALSLIPVIVVMNYADRMLEFTERFFTAASSVYAAAAVIQILNFGFMFCIRKIMYRKYC